MTLSTPIRMTLEEYLNYDDGTDTRYELVNGVLVAMGAESPGNVAISSFLFAVFLQFLPYFRIHRGTEIAVPGSNADTRHPDLVILTEVGWTVLATQKRSLVTADMPAPALVVEIVSPGPENRERDYVTKRQEYERRGIPEYWIVDPERGKVTLCQLQNNTYVDQGVEGEAILASIAFPTLKLTAAEVLRGGK